MTDVVTTGYQNTLEETAEAVDARVASDKREAEKIAAAAAASAAAVRADEESVLDRLRGQAASPEDLLAAREALAEENVEQYADFAAHFSAYFDDPAAPVAPGNYLDPLAFDVDEYFVADNEDIRPIPLTFTPSYNDAGEGQIIVNYKDDAYKFTKTEAVTVLEEGTNLSVDQAFLLTSAAHSNSTIREGTEINGSPYNQYLLYLMSQDEKTFGVSGKMPISNGAEILADTPKDIKQAAEQAYRSFLGQTKTLGVTRGQNRIVAARLAQGEGVAEIEGRIDNKKASVEVPVAAPMTVLEGVDADEAAPEGAAPDELTGDSGDGPEVAADIVDTEVPDLAAADDIELVGDSADTPEVSGDEPEVTADSADAVGPGLLEPVEDEIVPEVAEAAGAAIVGELIEEDVVPEVATEPEDTADDEYGDYDLADEMLDHVESWEPEQDPRVDGGPSQAELDVFDFGDGDHDETFSGQSIVEEFETARDSEVADVDESVPETDATPRRSGPQSPAPGS